MLKRQAEAHALAIRGHQRSERRYQSILVTLVTIISGLIIYLKT